MVYTDPHRGHHLDQRPLLDPLIDDQVQIPRCDPPVYLMICMMNIRYFMWDVNDVLGHDSCLFYNLADIIIPLDWDCPLEAIDAFFGINNPLPENLSVYSSVRGVHGSTVQAEWSEIGYKLGVVSSQFVQSPLTLKNFQTPNEAWSTAFVKELIRSGVT